MPALVLIGLVGRAPLWEALALPAVVAAFGICASLAESHRTRANFAGVGLIGTTVVAVELTGGAMATHIHLYAILIFVAPVPAVGSAPGRGRGDRGAPRWAGPAGSRVGVRCGRTGDDGPCPPSRRSAWSVCTRLSRFSRWPWWARSWLCCPPPSRTSHSGPSARRPRRRRASQSAGKVTELIDSIAGETAGVARSFGSTTAMIGEIHTLQIEIAVSVEEQSTVLAEVTHQLSAATEAAEEVLEGLDQLTATAAD